MVAVNSYLTRSFGLKRMLDLLLGGMLILLASPLMLGTAVAVKLTSSGPIFFRQSRLGKDEREFICYKFRSMKPDADSAAHRKYIQRLFEDPEHPGKLHKLADDSRVTPVGAWIRRLSLDELPQLFNVIKGDMSLVGPRPAIVYELQHYRPEMFSRFAVRPGLTGLWQVSGRAALGYLEMVEKDLEYVQKGNFILDMKIILKTPVVVLDIRRTR